MLTTVIILSLLLVGSIALSLRIVWVLGVMQDDITKLDAQSSSYNTRLTSVAEINDSNYSSAVRRIGDIAVRCTEMNQTIDNLERTFSNPAFVPNLLLAQIHQLEYEVDQLKKQGPASAVVSESVKTKNSIFAEVD